MFSKTFLLFFLVIRLALIRSEDDFSIMTFLQPIQSEMFESISTFTNIAWNETLRDNQNFHLFPMMESLRHYVELMRIFYGTDQARSQDIFLERPRAFANILDKLENSSKVTLNFSQILFFDGYSAPPQYVLEMKTKFHVDPRPFTFEKANVPEMETALTEWTSKVTNGLQQRNLNIVLAGKTTLEYVIFNFKALWHTTKNTIVSIETSPDRPRRFVPPMPKLPTLDFQLLDQMIKANAIHGREKIGYYNNVDENYVAIRIPFSNEEFAMAVVLPHYGYSLEVLRKFTEADYRILLQRLKENRENVHYTIPFINSTALLINDIGVSINEDNFRDLVVVREEPKAESGITYRPFFVDRPFGVIIYHEKTLFVLLYALVRDPTSNLWPIAYFRTDSITSDGKEDEIKYIHRMYKSDWYTRYW